MQQPPEFEDRSDLCAALQAEFIRRADVAAVEWIVTGRWPTCRAAGWVDIHWVADGLEGLPTL
jgi:hypothetical protein